MSAERRRGKHTSSSSAATKVRSVARRLCLVCRWRPSIVKGRCRTCYEYLRRNGSDRPDALVTAHAERLDPSGTTPILLQALTERKLRAT